MQHLSRTPLSPSELSAEAQLRAEAQPQCGGVRRRQHRQAREQLREVYGRHVLVTSRRGRRVPRAAPPLPPR